MDPLSFTASIVAVIDLGRRYASLISPWTDMTDDARQLQDHIVSLNIKLDEIKRHLWSLETAIEGTDLEHTALHCFGICEDLSRMLRSVHKEQFSKRGLLFALERANWEIIQKRLLLLHEHLSPLALKSIRWHNLDDPSHPALKDYLDTYCAKSNLANHQDDFPVVYSRLPAGPALLHLLTSNVAASTRELCKVSLKNDILVEIYKKPCQIMTPMRVLDPVRQKDMESMFLRRLRYPGMDERVTHIKDAYESSCTWILDKKRVDGASFQRWASTSSLGGLCWIAGAPGAGKSTLIGGKDESDLLRFIKDAPLKLNGLLRYFVDELDATQHFVGSVLRFIALSRAPVTLLRLSLMDKDFPDFVLNQEISPFTQGDFYRETEKSIEKIVSKSKGLLEVSCPDDHHILRGLDAHVTLVHRAVRDFFETEIVSNGLYSNTGDCYDLAARYSAASLSLLKISDIGDLTVQSISVEAIRCAYTATLTQTRNEKNMMRVLDELEYTCYTLLEGMVLPTPWMNVEQRAISLLVHQNLQEEWIVWAGQDENASVNLRQRAIALCLRFDVARLVEVPKKATQWPEWHFNSSSRISDEDRLERKHILGSSSVEASIDVSRVLSMLAEQGFYMSHTDRTNQLSIQDRIAQEKTRSTFPEQGTAELQGMCGVESVVGPSSLNNSMETRLVQVKHEPLENVPSHWTWSEVPANDSKPIEDDGDDSDDRSWESFSSSDLSLDDDHPLVALKAGATQAVLEGFMEYYQRRVDGESKVSEAAKWIVDQQSKMAGNGNAQEVIARWLQGTPNLKL